ncbi:sensor histidine kinase [Luteimicrobium subarcticum]|uniref:histidine kinase n=1 Tax=Luteimicrobium subarcticum TaxID=620910 RepID=A0A2M8W6W6_9MICO|nr:histidine kinase [Luteimicrobium subarcticum]PJI86673.1 signal transduction histidine kinase [Luteimicrobium subarcticum]
MTTHSTPSTGEADCTARWTGLSRAGVAVSTAAIAVLTVLAVVSEQPPQHLALDVVCGVLSVLGAAFVLISVSDVPRRRALATGAGALAALGALSPGAMPASTMTTLVVARTMPLRSAIPAAVAGAAGQAVRGAWRDVGIGYGWWLLCDVGVHAALLGWGAYARTRADLVASLRGRVRAAEADRDRRAEQARRDERLRIARDMHDTLAHRLSLVAASAGAVAYRPDAPPERLAAAALVVRDGVAEALDELRAVIGVLRDPETTVPDLDTLVTEARHAGTPVEPTIDPAVVALTATTRGAVARTVQEALTNARRHAPGEVVRLDVAVDAGGPDTGARWVRVVASNPVPRPDAPAHRPGVGLAGLGERAAALGGRLDAGVVDARWTLRVDLPVAPERVG